MKTRQGFVSNSSSSSFIVKKDEQYPTIWDVALAMIPIRGYGESDIRARLYVLQHSCESPQAITFPTRNYDTYILDQGDEYWIATSNNHGFYVLPGFEAPVGHACDCNKAKTRCEYCDWSLADFILFFMKDNFEFQLIEV